MDSTSDADRQRRTALEPSKTESLEVEFLIFGPGSRVLEGADTRCIVDIERETLVVEPA